MKTVKTAVVGLGRLGGRHAVNVARFVRGAELVAICDADAKRLDEYGEMLGVKRRCQTFEEVLDVREVEAVVIVSPSVFHCRQIAQALDSGRHVFSEKPLGVTVEECLDAEKAVARHPELCFMLGFMRRFDESYAYAHAKVAAGEIGRVVLFRGCSQDPERFIHEAIAFAPTSGGLFLDMAVHDIDLARWFVGSEPEEVWSIGDCYAHPEFARSNDVDNGSCLMRFANGAMGFLFAGRTAPHGYNVEAEIVGTKGILRVSAVPQLNLVEVLDSSGVRKECYQRFDQRFAAAYLNEMQEFYSCLAENRKPDVTVQDGVRATRIAYKCKESLATGNKLSVNM